MNRFRALAALPLALGLALAAATPGHAAGPLPENLSYEMVMYSAHCLSASCDLTNFLSGTIQYAETEVYGRSGQKIGTPQFAYFDCQTYYSSGGNRWYDDAYTYIYSNEFSGQAGVASPELTYEQSEANLHGAGFMNLFANDPELGGTWIVRGASVTNNVNDTLVGGRFQINALHTRIDHFELINGEYYLQSSSTGNVSCANMAPAYYAENELEYLDGGIAPHQRSFAPPA